MSLKNAGMMTSLHVFRSFLSTLNGVVDASKIHSKECYQLWLTTRGLTLGHAEAEAKKFQRALTNHLSGVDGRCPFTVAEEQAILKVLRRKSPWPCFPLHLNIGSMGYRSKGYHEKALFLQNSVREETSDNKTTVAHRSAKRVRMSPFPQNEEEINQLTSQLMHFDDVFHNMKIDVWSSIWGILRFRLFPPEHLPKRDSSLLTERFAKELCSRHAENGKLVRVFDFFGQNGKQLVLAENELATRMLTWRGLHLPLLVKALYEAFYSHGNTAPLTQIPLRLDGKVVHVKIWVDKPSYLLVFQG